MKKTLIFTLLLLLLSLHLSACTNGGDTSSSEANSVTDTSAEPSESTEESSKTDSKVYAKEIIVTEGSASSRSPYSVKIAEQIKALTEMLENCTYTHVDESIVNDDKFNNFYIFHNWLHFVFEDSKTEPLFSNSFTLLNYGGNFYTVEGFDYEVWRFFKSDYEYAPIHMNLLTPDEIKSQLESLQ